MKKFIYTIFFFLAVFALSAQDLIYTVSAEIDQQKTSLDSILVENLSNDTRILFDNLPALEFYQINLTKNAFWGTVGASDTEMKPEFVETRNLPGFIQLAYRGISPVEARLSVFNINGQLVYAAERKTLYPNNSIRVQLTATGVYFVQIQSPLGTKTFKAIGSEEQTDYGVEITEETSSGVKFKSSFMTANTDFSFMEGDSIRMSVYKDEYYAPPSSLKINTSKFVNFEFRVSSVVKTGVSDAYVELDENTTNVAVYDTLSGQVNIEYTGDKPELKPGDIITVDVDTAGYLRKVVETIDQDGVITVETEQAYFDEVFVDMEIKLHTSLMNPGVQLKSTSTPREISKALTDEDGYIHPVEVIYQGADSRPITKSAITDPGTSDESIPIIDFYRDLAMDLYGKEGDDIRFYIDEGHVSLTSDAVFEFDMKDEGGLDEDTKVKKGDLRNFKFYLDSEAQFLTLLALEMSKSLEKENTKKLIDLRKVTAKFFVGTVPVWITFDVDIFSKYHFTADASLRADWGFESNHTLQIGGNYDKESDSFIPIKEYTPENTVFPLNLEGEINAYARMEVYPRAEIMFYSFFGPYAEIVPYVQGNYNAVLQSQITGGGAETFLAWNSGIDLGLDFRVGTKLSFLWGLANKEFGPTVRNCFENPLWQTPVTIELITELPEEVNGADDVELRFEVTDLLGLPVPACPVYIEGDGTFSKQILFTNTNGEVDVNWTLPDLSGTAEFMATIYRANGSVIKQINRWVNVSDGGTSVETGTLTDSRDGNTYKTVKIGDQWWMAENLAYLPEVSPSSSSFHGSATAPYYYVYGYQGTDVAAAKATDNYITYGVLYNWPAALDSALSSSANPSGVQGVCPTGWHLPSDAEWTQLTDYLGGTSVSGGKLKETGTSHWTSPNTGATNKSGFTALPGGYRYFTTGAFNFIGSNGLWWSTTETEDTASYAWYRLMSYNNSNVSRASWSGSKKSGFSVRCVKD